jgi:hypothetical protein
MALDYEKSIKEAEEQIEKLKIWTNLVQNNTNYMLISWTH